ncbi:hypothetical protein BKA80DRAFT_275937 [Phyllosticta citrichinensis]
MAHFDREWANMHENPDNRKPKASGEQIVELENQDSAMHDGTAMLQEDGVAPEIAPSKSPEDVVETIETTDTTMGEATEVPQAESIGNTSLQVVQKIETPSAEPGAADPVRAGSEGNSFDSMVVEPSTSNAIYLWDSEDEQLHRASSFVAAPRSNEQEFSSGGLSRPELLAPPDSVVTTSGNGNGSTSKPIPKARSSRSSRSRGRQERKAAALTRSAESSRDRSIGSLSSRASNTELLAPPNPEVTSGSSGGSTNKPMPKVRSRSRGRVGGKAVALSRSAESSRERSSKRQASQEPDGPQPPTQRRRSKMERELDWSLKK